MFRKLKAWGLQYTETFSDLNGESLGSVMHRNVQEVESLGSAVHRDVQRTEWRKLKFRSAEKCSGN